MSAEERLRYYAAQFPLTEIDSTYYAPPSRASGRSVGGADADRVPLRRQGLLAAHRSPHPAAEPMGRHLRDALPPGVAEKRNLYAHHLSQDALDEAWRRFGAALRPIHEAGKTGGGPVPVSALVRATAGQPGRARGPPRASPGLSRQRGVPLAEVAGRGARPGTDTGTPRGARSDVRRASTRRRCPVCPACSRSPIRRCSWCGFHGRADDTWPDGALTAAERFRYLYSRQELEELARPSTARSSPGARETPSAHEQLLPRLLGPQRRRPARPLRAVLRLI